MVNVTFKDELYSTYGGILKIILKREMVHIEVNSSTANALGTQKLIRVFLPENANNIIKVKQHLQLMFEDEPSVFVSQI